jgi:transcriptional regulator with XRE-family HTH domain
MADDHGDPLVDDAGRRANDDFCAAALGATMRLVRRARNLRAVDVAREIGMPLRSYEYLESGRGRVSFARVMAFARATDTDAWALLASGPLDSPDFALRCADNKLMTILMITIKELDDDLADDIVFLEPGTLIGAFTRIRNELAQHVRKRDQFAETWLSERTPMLGRGLRRPRGGADGG